MGRSKRDGRGREGHAISYSCENDTIPFMGWNPRDGDGEGGWVVKCLP